MTRHPTNYQTQLRRTAVRADAVAAQNAKRRHELAEPAIWREVQEEFLDRIRSEIRAMPARLAPLLTGNVIQRQAVLRDEVHRVLSVLACPSTYQRRTHRGAV